MNDKIQDLLNKLKEKQLAYNHAKPEKQRKINLQLQLIQSQIEVEKIKKIIKEL